ncbi:MAG: MFS transporter [Dehalococcoidia bacterium]
MRDEAEPSAPAASPTVSRPEPQGFVWQRYLGMLRYGELRTLWLAQVVSQIGDGMMTVAIVWLTLRLTGNSVALSAILVASTLPYLFGIFTGALVDRWDRVTTMVMSDLMRGIIVLLVPAINAVGSLHVWELAVMSFLLALAGQFFDPSKAALTPSLVPPEELVRANALLTGTRQILFVAGPAIGGSLIAVTSVLGVFYLDALTFFGSAAVLFWLHGARKREREVERTRRGSDILRDIRDGFVYIKRRRVLQSVIALGALLNFLLSPLPLLIPLYIKRVVKSGALQFGSLTSVIFVGFLVGAILVAVLGNKVGKGRLAGCAIIGTGIASAGFALGLPLWPTMAIGAVGGAGIGISNISAITIVQEQSNDEFRGRVYAFYDSLAQMGRPLSLVIGAFAAEAIGIRAVFLAVGVLTFLAGIPVLAVRSLRTTP